MAKLLRFSLFSVALLSITQLLVYSLYVTPTGGGAKNGTSWCKAVDNPRFQIAINCAATSVAANLGHGGLVWSNITSSS